MKMKENYFALLVCVYLFFLPKNKYKSLSNKASKEKFKQCKLY